jgi:hypothetical protein
MSSITAGGYTSTNVTNLKGRYQEPSIVTTRIPNLKNGHLVKPNRVIVKYPNF